MSPEIVMFSWAMGVVCGVLKLLIALLRPFCWIGMHAWHTSGLSMTHQHCTSCGKRRVYVWEDYGATGHWKDRP